MWLVVGGLAVLVFCLARKSPGVQPTTGLDANMSVPATGGTDTPSPASANGSPMASQANGIRLDVSYRYAQDDQKVLSDMVPDTFWRRRDKVLSGNEYMTAAQSNLMTQDVPPIVQSAPNGNGGQKI